MTGISFSRGVIDIFGQEQQQRIKFLTMIVLRTEIPAAGGIPKSAQPKPALAVSSSAAIPHNYPDPNTTTRCKKALLKQASTPFFPFCEIGANHETLSLCGG